MKLSILIPVYNEQETVKTILTKIQSLKLYGNIKKEIVIVDDYSNDKTSHIIKDFIKKNTGELKYFRHDRNKGKGAALNTAINKSTGDIIIFQDADEEYDPNDFNKMLKLIINNHADVVYGSRFSGGDPHRVLFFWHTIGNKLLTFLSNLFTDLNLTDMETCYKMFRSGILKNIKIKEKRFGIEPEITAKISRIPNIRIYEVGISYYGRTYEEGKKIGWKDGFRAIYCIIKYNLNIFRG